MKQSDERNEDRFKKLEDVVYQNKKPPVRFETNPTKVGVKRGYEETSEVGDRDMGGTSKPGSSRDGGDPANEGGVGNASWGVAPGGGSRGPARTNSGTKGVSDNQGPSRAKPSNCRLWVKGFGRRLTKNVLEEQAEMVISKMNTGLSERDKFCVGEGLRILAWNGEYSVALVFGDSADYERFYRRSGSAEVKGRFLWEDPLCTEGPKVLRVHKDASFDQRLRSQVFYNLRKEVVAHLTEKKVWDSDRMEVIDSGVKGTVFLTAGEEIYDLFKVNINHGDGRSHYVKPVYETFSHPWGVKKEDVEGIMTRAMAGVSLLERQEEKVVFVDSI